MVSEEQAGTRRSSPGPSPATRPPVPGGGRWPAWASMLSAAASLAIWLGLFAAPGAAALEGGKTTSACPKQATAALPLSAHAAGRPRRLRRRRHPSVGPQRERRKDRSSKVATEAGARGREVAFQCGKRIQVRTIVVELRFPKELPSTSLAEGVVFVSHFKRGYEVWEVAH